jgi:hypothetical protein
VVAGMRPGTQESPEESGRLGDSEAGELPPADEADAGAQAWGRSRLWGAGNRWLFHMPGFASFQARPDALA